MLSLPRDRADQVPLVAVVDDDSPLRELIETLLRGDGYRTIGWGKGQGAYELIRQEQPDLVILDLWMENPAAGGMVLALLELDPSTNRIPVIVCSSHMQLFDDQQASLREKGYALITKPFAIEELLWQARRLLNQPQSKQIAHGEGVA